MSYKLILCWEDAEEDMELVQYKLPVTVGHHEIDKVLVGHRGRMLSVRLSADVAVDRGS